MRDRNAVLYVGRILGRDASERQWNVDEAVLCGTETCFCGKVPSFHHVSQRWLEAAVWFNEMRIVGVSHVYGGIVEEF